MATRTITRFTSDYYDASEAEQGSHKLLTVPSDVKYAQLVDIRILYDTSDYGDLHKLRFGLYAMDSNGNRIATFYPSNYVIETYNTQFYTCFAHYVQLPAGTIIYWTVKLDDPVSGKGYNVCVNATLETYI